MTTKQSSKAAKIRTLRAEGLSSKATAAMVGVPLHYVHCVMSNAKARAKKVKAKAKHEQMVLDFGKELPTQVPKRKYVKSGKYATKSKMQPPAVAKPKQRMATSEDFKPEIRYVQVDVPQPHYNLTWGQRFKALFTGRV